MTTLTNILTLAGFAAAYTTGYLIGRHRGYEQHRRKVLGRLYEAVRAAGQGGAMEEDR